MDKSTKFGLIIFVKEMLMVESEGGWLEDEVKGKMLQYRSWKCRKSGVEFFPVFLK